MRKAFDLRPLEFGDILSRSFALYVQNFTLFSGLFLIFVFVPSALIELGQFAFLRKSSTNTDSTLMFLKSFLFIFQIVLAWALAGGGIYYLVSRVYLGSDTSIMQALQAILSHLGALLTTGVIVLGVACIFVGSVIIPAMMAIEDRNGGAGGIAILISFVAVPAMFLLYGRFGLVFCVVMLEDLRPDEALVRSARLTKHFGGRLVGIFFAMVLCFALLRMPGELIATAMAKHGREFELMGALLSLAWQALVAPVLAIPPAIYYFDLRCRKEGFDLAVLAASFGVDPNFLAQLQAQGRNSYDIPGYVPKGQDASTNSPSVLPGIVPRQPAPGPVRVPLPRPRSY